MLLGLGSIVGTGVFVSLAIGAGATGPSVVLALGLAGILAGLNGMSSAQLAAAWPVSGGTYEYGYRALGPFAGFTAGWMFLAAKSASAATAALGLAGYAARVLGLPDAVRTPLAFVSVCAVTGLVVLGMRRSNAVNTVLVGFTLLVLAALAIAGAPHVDPARLTPFFGGGSLGFLEATALMFVAYTGYGRIATLGEEVVDPRRTIPRAIWATLFVVVVLYVGVGAVAVGVLGAPAFAGGGPAPLEPLAAEVGGPALRWAVTLAAGTAMAGVLLNLVLGLSRVLLAMARRGDMPARFAVLDAAGTTPVPAVLGVGALIALLTLIGDVKATWSFSAFTVLVYYALTNLCATRLEGADRLYPRAFAWAGFAACLGLAFWVEPAAWGAGLALLAAGHALRAVSK
ncbi:MAG: amino acid permease [Alphaproteobacteria bacterium]|nr:amino acid permease [Alphaproteobacteria bacterium]